MTKPPSSRIHFRAGILLFILFFIVEESQAQADSVQFVEASPHFGASLATSLLQNRDGFLWIMAPWRLYRFDGISYAYYHSGKGSRSFGEDFTFKDLWGGRKNFLCINASVNSLVFLNTESMRHQVVALSQPDCPDTLGLTVVMEDALGRFWVGTREGKLILVEPPDMTIRRLYDCGDGESPTMSSAIQALIDDDFGNVWIGTDSGLFMLPAESAGATVNLSSLRAVGGMPTDSVVRLTHGKDGLTWACLSDGSIGRIVTGDLRFDRVTRIPSPSAGHDVSVLIQDHSGNLWVATPLHGLMRWNVSRSSWSRHLMHTDPTGREYPPIVRDAIVDRAGVLWALDQSSALMKYDPRPRPFHAFASSQGSGPRLSARDVNALCIDGRGGLWVGTGSSGIDYLAKGGRTFRRFVHDPRDPTTLVSNKVICLRAMRDGTVWVGTLDGISVYDYRTRKLRDYRHEPADSTSLGDNVVTTIYEDSHGIIWVGHWLGLDTFDRSTGEFSSVLRWPKETIGLVGTVAVVFEDSRGSIWAGTAGRGLVRISSSRDTLWYRQHSGVENALPGDRVNAVYEDREGRLWFGMGSSGLVLFDRDSERFEQFRPMYTFPAPGIGPGSPPPPQVLGVSGILEDRRGDLWLALQGGGLGKFDVRQHSFKRYDEKDGVVVAAGRRSAFCSSQDGTIFFGGPGGVTWFHPDSIVREDAAYDPPVVITEFRVNQELRPVSQDSTRIIELSSSENSCSFAFAMLDYSDPNEYIYQYKLEGLDGDWIYARTDHKVTYASIPPGEYRFRVRAESFAGARSIREASLPLVISKPLWQTWWFMLVVLLALSGVTFALHRYRLARALALERLRLRIAGDLHDEIGSNLSGIALEGDVVAGRESLPDDIRMRLQGMTRLARESSQSMRDIVWLINPEHDTFGDLLTKMRETANSMLGGISHTFQTPDGMSGASMDLETKRTIFLMYKEVLHNIVKHSKAKVVCIEASLQDGHFRLKVRDDGIGFSDRRLNNGEGLKNLRRRASQAGGRIEITSAQGGGTTVEMEIRI